MNHVTDQVVFSRILYLVSRVSYLVHGGSYPPLQNGLHRQIRQTPLAAPFTGPYLRTDRMKYSLLPGVNRHIAGNSGRIRYW